MAKIECNRNFKLFETEDNKMNKKKRIATIIVAIAMFCMMSMSALAASNVFVSLPANQVWTDSAAVTRLSSNYSYIQASCDSVYPKNGGSDNFTKIQTRLVSSEDTLILKDDEEYNTLTEGKGYKKVYIKDGYIDKPTYIQFRGNTNAEAEAVVNYFGP